MKRSRPKKLISRHTHTCSFSFSGGGPHKTCLVSHIRTSLNILRCVQKLACKISKHVVVQFLAFLSCMRCAVHWNWLPPYAFGLTGWEFQASLAPVERGQDGKKCNEQTVLGPCFLYLTDLGAGHKVVLPGVSGVCFSLTSPYRTILAWLLNPSLLSSYEV